MIPFLVPALMAAGGAAASGLSALSKNKAKWSKKSILTPEQKEMSSWMRNQGQQQLQNPYQGFDPIAQRAQSVFKQQTVPSLAERFTSLGSSNALSSPAFAAQLGAAGQGLSEELASLMSQYGLQQQSLGQNLLGMGMRPEFENVYKPESQGFLSGMLGGLGSGLSAMGGAGLMKDLSNMQQAQFAKSQAKLPEDQRVNYGGNSMNNLAMKLMSQQGRFPWL